MMSNDMFVSVFIALLTILFVIPYSGKFSYGANFRMLYISVCETKNCEIGAWVSSPRSARKLASYPAAGTRGKAKTWRLVHTVGTCA